MKKRSILITMVLMFSLALSCAPKTPVSSPGTMPAAVPTEEVPAQGPDKSYLRPNPVETSLPIYGGVLIQAGFLPRSFDAHQKVGYGPTATLPVFNQLVMYDTGYKNASLENIVGDLAESLEISPDGTEITFKLRQRVKWHDGVPFTADDVVYSLDKMTDISRSVIADVFPAYQSSEKIDDNTVKVHLKYASAGFLTALAEGESQIQARHLAGTSDQSIDFMVGTGPFMLEDFKVRVHAKYKRNPDYFKRDQYGNQLPYLDGMIYYEADNNRNNEMLVGRRLDLKNTTTGAATKDTWEFLTRGAPELLWQKREKDFSAVMFLNLNHPPLNDIRVRRAMGLLIEPNDLIIGYSDDPMFGTPGQGLLNTSLGLPQEEVIKLMGWDKPYEERVAKAQRLMAEAGYPDGFKLNILSLGASRTHAGMAQVFAEALREHLNIVSDVNVGLGATDVYKRADDDNYDLFAQNLAVGRDPLQLKVYVGTGGFANYSHYSNPEIDKLLEEVDHIIDPGERREAIWAIERILLTDLPILPTGCFIANFMPYYPQVKNIRWTDLSYSNANRLEDVWIDESLRVK